MKYLAVMNKIFEYLADIYTLIHTYTTPMKNKKTDTVAETV